MSSRISPQALARLGWTPLGGRSYRHAAGWLIEHCGHPTALYPYALWPPDGGRMILAPNGHAWRTVAAAVDYVATHERPKL